ncbi:competence protein ComEC [Ulvibacter sp. MAR_2010_11]|uniref:ComEC/Rec2 family competence protein n=1 Tax=Ulvibacter sp. MAR_2010_11 TaxID=1250229 RepID=UPI000C2C3138|nr:ComEC/Rec2 family competence protein [Ulvibacter sp. MAR_2010_11]PKA82510.1 competence protein ComEC [Ulvibacter sp. MAR_2010_11]
MKFINFTVIHLSVSLTLGIVTASLFQTTSALFLYALLGCFILLIFLKLKHKYRLQPSIFFGITTYCCFFLIGFAVFTLKLPHLQPKHFSKHLRKDTSEVFQLKIKTTLKPDAYYTKYIAEIQGVNQTETSGKVLLLLSKDSLQNVLPIDQILLVDGLCTVVPNSLNPNQFEYANYLKTLEVYYQLKITPQHILYQSSGSATLGGGAEQLRTYLIKKLSEANFGKEELSIIQALVLGERKDIDKAMYSEYAAAGAVHILAVSGLHVGILFLVLNGLLKPLRWFPKGKPVATFITLLLLWSFALIAGFSPSVVRAVTMFSFFTLAAAGNRPTNSYNTLFLSYFILLLCNPNWLFHVGFQLSYLAVFFILWIQPKLFKLYYPRNYLIKKLWAIVTVSLAAQLGILPLSLYYFHQFPGLFLLTNIVILPFLGILLVGGILVIVLASINTLPKMVASAYNYLIEVLNDFIHWIAQQEAFLVTEIHFSATKVIASYLCIVVMMLLWKKLNFKNITICLVSFSLVLVALIAEKHTQPNQQFIVFHRSGKTILGHKQNDVLNVFRSDTSQNYSDKYPIKSYRIATNIASYSEAPLPSVFEYNSKKVLILGSLGVYPTNFKPDIVLLAQSPRIHLERLIDSLNPGMIVADGSNYTSYIQRWRMTCEKRKLPFYHTGTKGAFIIE